ncbi:sugar lactone lactonase YvrE [Alteribacter lacisalsi]|uniref:Regucalcin n=1 Tax=Alteribacter lacisalsi TaxID=2045244 RepID=A0A2W0H7S4_9BACI|nr:SMP-30/gluconolactonase/LRE family protein [Alteribacter lacisalsi]PYZ96786.1 sugar lactone lactonase YvrE [Alteribacter lacisalsi]
METEKLAGCENKLGEGPLWCEEDGRLYWVDIVGSAIYEFDYDEAEIKKYPTEKRPTALGQKKGSSRYVVLEDGLYLWEKITNTVEPVDVLDLPDGVRFNDGKLDPWGRFWAGTMGEKGQKEAGALYCWDTDGTRQTVLKDVTTSNGLAWDKQAVTMYYIDTGTRCILKFHYDETTGAIANKEIVYTFQEEDGVPDGMTIDSNGLLWVALFGGYRVAVINPELGEWVDTVDVPAKKVTCPAFGGPDGRDLFITTASVGLTEPDLIEYPDSGSLFVVRGVK